MTLRQSLLPLLLLAATLSVAHAVVTPALWPVDETSHVAYADHLYREGAVPTIDTPIAPDLPYPGLEQRLAWERREHREGRMDIWTANHPPLPFLIQGAALKAGLALGSPSLALLLARLTSTLWLLAAVVLTVRLAGRLVPGRPRVALAAGLVVATTPTVSHLAGLVFNDVAGLAASTACLLAGTVIAAEGPTPGRIARLGLASGVAALVRVSCLPAVAIGVALAVYGHVHHRRKTQGVPATGLVTAWAGFGTMLLPGAAFYLLNIARYGDIGAAEWLLAKFGRDPNTPVADLLLNGFFWRRLWNRLIGDLTTGHWSGGWLATVSGLLLLVAVGALLWLAVATLSNRARRRLTRPQQRLLVVWLACLALPLALVVSTVGFHSAGGSLHGRYVMGAHAVTAIVVAVGVARVPRLGAHAPVVLGVPLVVINAGLLYSLVTDPNQTWMRGGIPLPLPHVIGATTPVLWVLGALGATAAALVLAGWRRLPVVEPATLRLSDADGDAKIGRLFLRRLPRRALRLVSVFTTGAKA